MVDLLTVQPLPEAGDWPVTIPRIEDGWYPTGGDVNPGADEGIANWQAQLLAVRTRDLNDRVEALAQTAAQLVPVGPGQEYLTINAALEAVSRTRRAYVSGGVKVELRLVSGFVMAEQVIVNGVNLGGLVITGEDPQTTIRRSALVTPVSEFRYPAFCAQNGGVLPQIGQLFEMDGTGLGAARDGIMVRGMGASVDVAPGCGVKRAGGDGVLAQAGGALSAFSGVFTQAGDNGARVHSGSSVNLGSCDLSGAGGIGIYAHTGGMVAAPNAIVTGYGTYGMSARSGARIAALAALAQKAGADTATDLHVSQGGIIAAPGATGGVSTPANAITANGIIFK